MKTIKKLLAALACTFGAFCLAGGTADAQVSIFCYHEIEKPNDPFAIPQKELEQQIKDLKSQGYRFVSLAEYESYMKGELDLPEKSVLLTFDDGYASVYTQVFPLLQKYQVPAMIALVTSWTEGEGKPRDVGALLTWNQVREMEASGLVSVASHSHVMHKQQAIDPQGDRNAVAGYHLYFQNLTKVDGTTESRYETDEEYRTRVQQDLQKSQSVFKERLGHPVHAMVWPYGIFSGEAQKAAQAAGMEVAFNLGDRANNTPDTSSLMNSNRALLARTTPQKEFQQDLAGYQLPVRLAQVDIDALYDEDPAAFRANIQGVIEHLGNNRINLVALQAFADPDGDGNVDKVYFHNNVVPVAADVFNTVANAIETAGIRVVAWLPGLSYTTLAAADGSNIVQADGEAGWYQRLSPFDAANEAKLVELYRDLGRYTVAQGVLFQDDLYLNDFEDVSPAAKGTDAAAKTRRLTDLSLALGAAFRESRPDGLLLRDIYDAVVLNPASEAWFAQNYADCLKHYDYVVVMAYPYMDHEKDPLDFLQRVAKAVEEAGGTDKTIVKIQSYDWEKEQWLGQQTFSEQMKTLKAAGVRNLGYYPNTFCAWEK
ncbi:poly-beta-1,6-N-acetyl-D-glucosamine N-deacetylase PgaB [uncultured Selenomonas sp.]|uniref:poly-beta-1,6-N-acetyl-D-glucosamine N-deacetylase PgaB n=1 Tax=uncultured Selenomonas sp. TaxID=159275 RepID=UPI0025D07762|nr:poly-beta-1,6-N-acetyl-D-glucosamine N-deacetylase PgaB [uncultured Selenomonas sp.]